MTMDDTRVIHLKLNFVQTELPQTSSPSPFSPWPTRAKILAEFCRVFSSKTQVYCICTRRTTTTAYSTGISRYSSYKYFGSTEYREEAGVAWASREDKILLFCGFLSRRAQVRDLTSPFPLAPVSAAFSFPTHPSLILLLLPPFYSKSGMLRFPDFTLRNNI